MRAGLRTVRYPCGLARRLRFGTSEDHAVNRGIAFVRRFWAGFAGRRSGSAYRAFVAVPYFDHRLRRVARVIAHYSIQLASAGVVITARKRNNLCGAARSKLLDKVLYNSFAAPRARAREITAVNVIMKCVVEPKITRKAPTTRIISLRGSVLSCPKRIAVEVRCYSLCNRGCAVETQAIRGVRRREGGKELRCNCELVRR